MVLVIHQAMKHRVNKAYQEMAKSGFGPSPPFAIINANSYTIENEKRTFARKFNWGVQPIEDPKDTDVQILYKMITSHMTSSIKEHSEDLFNKYRRNLMKNEKNRIRKESRLIGILMGISIGFTVSMIGLIINKSKKSH